MRKNAVLLNLSKKGFTLIELIVVFSVIAIISTIGLASFVGYSRSQTLNQASIDLSTYLSTAKSKASSQIKPSAQCNNTTVLDGYSVSINIAASSYSLNVVCSGSTFVLTTAKLPAGVTFNSAVASPPTTTTNVFFAILNSSVTGTGNIVLTGYSQTKTITVNSLGVIQ